VRARCSFEWLCTSVLLPAPVPPLPSFPLRASAQGEGWSDRPITTSAEATARYLAAMASEPQRAGFGLAGRCGGRVARRVERRGTGTAEGGRDASPATSPAQHQFLFYLRKPAFVGDRRAVIITWNASLPISPLFTSHRHVTSRLPPLNTDRITFYPARHACHLDHVFSILCL